MTEKAPKALLIIALLLVAVIIVAVISFTLASSTTTSTAAQGPVYTVPQVQAGLSRSPQSWRGRSVLVSGVLGDNPCAVVPCHGAAYFIVSQKAVTTLSGGPPAVAQPQFIAAQPLLLLPPPSNPVRAFVQRIPVLGRLVERSFSGSARSPFQVSLLRTPRCAVPTCPVGVLLNPPYLGH